MQSSGQAHFETSAAVAETESSTTKLARDVRRNAEITQEAAKKAATEAKTHVPLAAQPASETTTAANVTTNAPNSSAARQVAATAEHIKGVGEHAASTAHEKGPAVTGNPSDIVPQLGAKTNEAVEQGKKDVEAASAAGATYLEQAKNIAGNVISSAQSYLSGESNQTSPSTTASTAGTTASNAFETTKQYAAEAQRVAQPHLEAAAKALQSGANSAATTAQPHIEAAAKALQSGANSAATSAQGYLSKTSIPGSAAPVPGGAPSTTAPVEGGPYTSSTLYPSESEKKVAKNA
ncbi:hypothetical protein OF83DRAFT_1108527 [Amylostereum chailletii]|nr:hypothetical protein OF83DRAFT_1108527 [Amylostereum chailletii]